VGKSRLTRAERRYLEGHALAAATWLKSHGEEPTRAEVRSRVLETDPDGTARRLVDRAEGDAKGRVALRKLLGRVLEKARKIGQRGPARRAGPDPGPWSPDGELHPISQFYGDGEDPREAWPLKLWGNPILWGLAVAPFASALLALLLGLGPGSLGRVLAFFAIFLSPGPWYAWRVRRDARQAVASEIVGERRVPSSNPAATGEVLRYRRDGQVVRGEYVVRPVVVGPDGRLKDPLYNRL
jgi:hypothetical protein